MYVWTCILKSHSNNNIVYNTKFIFIKLYFNFSCFTCICIYIIYVAVNILHETFHILSMLKVFITIRIVFSITASFTYYNIFFSNWLILKLKLYNFWKILHWFLILKIMVVGGRRLWFKVYGAKWRIATNLQCSKVNLQCVHIYR